MASEIPSSRPPAPATSTQRPAVQVQSPVLQVQSSLPAQLNVGDSTQAQVLAMREVQNAFQVLLRLSLANGQQSTIEVKTTQPLAAMETSSKDWP